MAHFGFVVMAKLANRALATVAEEDDRSQEQLEDRAWQAKDERRWAIRMDDQSEMIFVEVAEAMEGY